jgi:hypothetical protein
LTAEQAVSAAAGAEASEAARQAAGFAAGADAEAAGEQAALAAAWAALQEGARDSSGTIKRGVSREAGDAAEDPAKAAARKRQAALLHDIFPNPFQFPPVIDPACLRWQGGTVVKLAQAIYDDRAFDRLPILADALDDAGCTDTVILNHLRGPGPHVRGCFALDLVLGKS